MKSKKLIALMSSAFLLSGLIVAKPVKAEVSKDRIFGNNRYETSCEIAKGDFEKSKNVVIACGNDFADALCAAPLAKSLEAPILLTEKDNISQCTLDEIERLEAKNVVIVGGEGAVSNKVKEKLESKKLNVERVYGNNRYETSIKIAKEIKSPSSIVVTTGKGFADSLSMSSIAANKNMPIILCDDKNLSKEVKEYVKENGIKNSYILGGERLVSKSVEKELPSADRLAGKDRFETNLLVLKKFEKDLKFNKVYVTKALGKKDFADGLAVAPVAAKYPSPLVLVGNDASNEMKAYMKEKTDENSEIIALGSEKIVSKKILNFLSLKGQMDEVNGAINSSVKYIQGKKEKTRDDAITLAIAKQSVDEKTINELKNEIKENSSDFQLGDSAKATLLALALKEDPKNFAGINLIEKTSKLFKESRGFVNHKIWGVIALEAAGVKYDKNAAFEYLKNEQKKDGGFHWMEGIDESDEWPDTAAMAVYAMTMMGKSSYDKEVSDALKFLKDSLTKLEKDKDKQSVETLAQIVMAAVSAKDDLKNYKINGNNIIDEILTYRTQDGGFKHKKSDRRSNNMATYQTLQALLFYKNKINLYGALNNHGKFTLEITKDNGKEKILDKEIEIKENEAVLYYLKENAKVRMNGTFITSINGVSGVYWAGLTDEEKINDISGRDWFIYINSEKSPVGADGILPKNGDTITFDYHAYDWKEFAAPGETQMPIGIKVPKEIVKGEEFKIETSCGWTPLVKAKVTIDGKTYETDMNGVLKVTLDKVGKHGIKVEKSGYSKELEIEVKESTEKTKEATTNADLQKAA